MTSIGRGDTGVNGKEKAIVREAEEEWKRRGGFKLIFPNEHYSYYKQFFEEDRPLNAVLHQSFRNQHMIPQTKHHPFLSD